MIRNIRLCLRSPSIPCLATHRSCDQPRTCPLMCRLLEHIRSRRLSNLNSMSSTPLMAAPTSIHQECSPHLPPSTMRDTSARLPWLSHHQRADRGHVQTILALTILSIPSRPCSTTMLIRHLPTVSQAQHRPHPINTPLQHTIRPHSHGKGLVCQLRTSAILC